MAVETGDAAFEGVEADSDRLAETFYPLSRRFFGDGQFAADLERKLAESRMTVPVEMYLSRALGVGVVAGLALWVVGVALGWSLFATGAVDLGPLVSIQTENETLVWLVETLGVVKTPAAVLFVGVVLGSLGFGAGFGTLVALPYSRSASREREINMLLSDSVSYMYSLSVGGLDQIEILQAMAKADDTYGEVSREFRSIVQETEYFDTDYRTAVRQQAMETPSDELSQFLTDMLSIINSGGDMTQFLDDKKEKHMRTAKQQQESILESLELFGEMYMTLSLFPLLLIIVLVIMNMLGNASSLMLYVTVYGLIPVIGAAFLVLLATFKWDEPGDGYLDQARTTEVTKSGPFDRGLIDEFAGSARVFDRIRDWEGTHETLQILRRPHVFFRDNPAYTLAVTVPLTAVLLTVAVLSDAAPASWNELVAQPVWGTFVLVYLPVYLVATPYAVARYVNRRARYAVLATLSDDLRKLSSANDTGLTLLESIRLVGETSSGKLASEFRIIYAKVKYGMSLREALVSFNNKYHLPRLARTVRLVSKAQEASNHITAVIRTAAQASENQDDIVREQRARTRMQVVVVVLTYLTLLAVMAVLKTQFLDVMSGFSDATAQASAGGSVPLFGGGANLNLLSMLFFHAVTVQAVFSGLISGYMRDGDLLSGIKYVVALLSVALAVWMVVG